MIEIEKDVEQHLVSAVKSAGGLCLKWVCPGWAGVPDRICLFPNGHICFVELKRPKGGVISVRQQQWAYKLGRLGFNTFFIKSKEGADALVKEYADL